MMNTDWTILEDLPLQDRAIMFATLKHSGQPRKGTGLPYITHVMEAMEIVSRMTDDEELRAAAVLHDTLEDTDTSKEELIHFFGNHVADLVEAESEDKRPDQPEGETWLTRKQETIHYLSHASTEVRMLALGDKLSNVRAMHRDYQALGEKLWERFNQKDPIKQGMYYGLLANVFWEDEILRETPAYREYVELCSDLFSKEYDGDGNLIDEDDANNASGDNDDIEEDDTVFPPNDEDCPEMPEAVRLLLDIRFHSEKYYPLVDHNTWKFDSKTESGDVNIGWNIGVLDDNRPWFAECWARDQITMLTYFISTKDLEGKTSDELVNILEQAGIVRFTEENHRSAEVATFSDSNNNEFYSVNIAVGVEDETYLTRDSGKILPFRILNDLNVMYKEKDVE